MPDSMNFEDWLDKAKNDLMAAVAILGFYEEPPTDTICYHCHQVAEKCFKAFVIAKTSTLHPIHNLNQLLKKCLLQESRFERFITAAQELNRYSVDRNSESKRGLTCRFSRVSSPLVAQIAVY